MLAFARAEERRCGAPRVCLVSHPMSSAGEGLRVSERVRDALQPRKASLGPDTSPRLAEGRGSDSARRGCTPTADPPLLCQLPQPSRADRFPPPPRCVVVGAACRLPPAACRSPDTERQAWYTDPQVGHIATQSEEAQEEHCSNSIPRRNATRQRETRRRVAVVAG